MHVWWWHVVACCGMLWHVVIVRRVGEYLHQQPELAAGGGGVSVGQVRHG